MSWEVDLAARLLNAPAVSAIAGDRIEWDDLAPDSLLPALMLQTITDARPQNHDGFDPFWPTRVQFNSVARTKTEAVALLEAAIAVVIPFAVQGSTTFLRSFVDGGGSDAERTATGRRNRARSDLIIWHN